MGITIKDIARMGNTSIATVSRVLSNKPGVSKATRLRIQEIIDQTGYRPSLVAQNLALRKSLNLGFIASNLVNSFYVDIFRQIEKLTRNQGYHLLLMDSEQDVERERENIKLMRQHQVEGLIIVPVHDYDESTNVDHLLRLRLQKCPFVVFGKVEGYGFDCVTTEERNAARNLTNHLLEYGHRRFVFVGDVPNNRCVRERIQGVKDALNAKGIELPQESVIPMDDIWFDRVRKVLESKDRPTALILSNDSGALVVLQIARELGLSAPKDISIGCFGDREATRLVQPALTTCSENLQELARLCHEILMAKMDDAERPASTHLVPPFLAVRQSTGSCPEGV